MKPRKPILRKTPLPRGTKAIARTGRPKRVNAARKASEFARCYGSKARVAWVASLPCLVPFCRYTGASENAHTTTGGTGRKADAETIIPLCPSHHRQQHANGWAAIGLGSDWMRFTAASLVAEGWERRRC